MLISMKDIGVEYGKKGNKVIALDNTSLDVKEGEFLVIMGKSGCGKSTLLNVLGTLRTPSNGRYFFDEQDVFSQKEKELSKFRNKNIGFIVQHFALINEKTVYDNICLPLQYSKTKSKDIEKRVAVLLEELELTEKRNAYPNELSGGQCQRVAIARALITNPKVILADEPTGALDEETGKKIMNLLQKINREGTTIIMVTHDADFAKMGSRSVTMRDGKIVL